MLKIYKSKINNEIYFIEEILDSNNNILEQKNKKVWYFERSITRN